MSDGSVPLVTIPLQNGAELSVAPDGIRIRDALYALAAIQDARQVAPEPETVALRVAGTGLVEFQPARPGDGALALEALFRLRPELRPAGFAPILPVALPPLPAPRVPQVQAPVLGQDNAGKPWVPDQRVAVPLEVASAYGPEPNRGRAELTPYPRRFGQLVGAILRLYGRHIGAWLALAFVVALLPDLVTNGLQVALDAQRGINPLAGRNVLDLLLNGAPSTPPATESAPAALLGSLVSMLEFVLGAWTVAALTIGSRDALLGRRVSFKMSIGGGFRRLWRTLGATLLVILILLGATLIALLLSLALAVLLAIVALPFAGSAAVSGSGPTPLRIALVACAMVISFLPVLSLGVRLSLAPALAALGYEDPVRRSLLLTRGQWWRTFGVLLLAGLPVLAGEIAVFATEYVAVGPALVVVSPLVQLLVAPWIALAQTALIYDLYDLRLRREGYLVFMQEHVTPPPHKTV